MPPRERALPEVNAQQRNTVAELLAPGLRRHTILLWIVSFAFFCASNGIIFMLPTILTQRGFSLTQAVGFVLVMSLVSIVGYSVCSFLIDVYGELYPTRLRATAVGWFFGLGRIGSFLAPSVIGLLLAGGLGDFVLQTFAIAYLIAAFATLAIGVETRGLMLEQASEIARRQAPPVPAAV
jgi:putative MFS transporter